MNVEKSSDIVTRQTVATFGALIARAFSIDHHTPPDIEKPLLRLTPRFLDEPRR
jgi:hypothetical protein